MRKQALLVGVGLLALAAAACSTANPGTTGSSSNTGTVPKKTIAPKTPTATGPKTAFGDGTWVVGRQIAAGTYHTSGGDGCYWERMSDLTGGSNSTLANDNASGPVTLSILHTDAAFKTQGCGTWSREPRSGPRATSFDDGTYAVGIDIAPGTYSTQGGGSCYWERESDLTWGGNGTIANDNASGPVTLTIARTDKGFKTQGCGRWSKSG